MANPEKFQSMTLGCTDQDFSFVVNGTHIKKSDDIDLLGVNIDSKLAFDKHVSVVCSKVNKQLQVIKWFKRLVSRKTRQRLYNAFIQPAFQYCSDVWHHCRHVVKISSNSGQSDDPSSTYEELLRKLHMVTLEQSNYYNIFDFLVYLLYSEILAQ